MPAPCCGPGLHPEACVLRRGGWMREGLGANPLVAARTTDMGGVAAYYAQPCRIENA